jgi:UDP-N-acetylglucosamine:LPS N-acetylglucosamine transferase
LAAVVLRIPLVVAEQNAVPGAANRLVGRFARACVVSFPDTTLPRSTVTGNPVRSAIRTVADGRRGPGEGASDRQAARQALCVDGRPFVVVFGGSLGARRINRAVARAVEDWTGGPVVIEHVVGARGWIDPRERAGSPAPNVEYRPVEYEADMPTVLSAVDLVVCRAGATSVAELSAIGVPSILIPLPGAPGDHQTANALHLERSGGARLVPDGELDGARLEAELSALLADPTALATMADGARSVGVPDAADRVVDVIADLLDGRPGLGDSSS